MSYSAVATVMDSPLGPPSLKLTLAGFAHFKNDQTGRLNPSMAKIAALVGVSRSQAQRLVHGLMDMGLLTVLDGASGGAPGSTPQYQLHLDRLPASDGTGRTGATGSVDATGSTDAAEGSHGCTGGVASTRQTGRTDATQTEKNRERTKKEQGKRQRNAPTRRISADWQPDPALQAWTREKRPDLDLPALVEAFRDHYLATGVARASWSASFRTWVKKERPPVHRPTRHSGFAEKNYREGVGDDGSFR